MHRRQEVPAPTPADASATPVHEEGETIVKAKIPEPSRPVEDRGFLPFIIVGALFVILGLLTVRSVRRLHRLHVNVRNVVPHPHLHGHGEPKQASHSKPSAASVAVPDAPAPVAPAIQPPVASAPQSPEPETAVLMRRHKHRLYLPLFPPRHQMPQPQCRQRPPPVSNLGRIRT